MTPPFTLGLVGAGGEAHDLLRLPPMGGVLTSMALPTMNSDVFRGELPMTARGEDGLKAGLTVLYEAGPGPGPSMSMRVVSRGELPKVGTGGWRLGDTSLMLPTL